MIDPHEKDDWRKVMLAQYNIFGTIAGLEVTSLAIFASLFKSPLMLYQKYLFALSALVLIFEVPLMLWLINQERKVAFNEQNMVWFKKNETHFRNFLILLMGIGWSLILILLATIILFN